MSPGAATPRIRRRPSIEFIDSLTLPSSRNNTLSGLSPSLSRTVVATEFVGDHALTVYYKTIEGVVLERMHFRTDEPTLFLAEAGRPWAFDASGQDFKLAAEAFRIHLAHLFDPMMAVHTSNVEPLPHQITAVYEAMLTVNCFSSSESFGLRGPVSIQSPTTSSVSNAKRHASPSPIRISIDTGIAPPHTPTGNGLGLDSSGLASGLRQRSNRPCSRLIRPVYQYPITNRIRNGAVK